jgi:hypothetical protein
LIQIWIARPEMAERMGVSRATLPSLERGDLSIRLGVLVRALGVMASRMILRRWPRATSWAIGAQMHSSPRSGAVGSARHEPRSPCPRVGVVLGEDMVWLTQRQ